MQKYEKPMLRQVVARVPDNIFLKLQELAVFHGIGMADLIRDILAGYIINEVEIRKYATK